MMAKQTKTEAISAAKNLAAEQRNLIATASNDITIPYYSNVLINADDTLVARGGGKGLKIYDEIERDTHAYAVLQKRKFALIGRDWTLEPASDSSLDKAAAAFIEEQIKRLNFDQLCLDLLDATLKGFSVGEIIWGRAGSAIIPTKIVTHDPRRFAFDENWQPRLLTMSAMLYGEELPERKFIVHRFGVKGNNPYGLGLGSKLFWPVLFKREGITFWLTFLEKFAAPTPVGKYPMGMLPDEQRKLLGSLEGMRNAGAVVVPMGTDVSFLEATRSGSVQYQDWCKYWDTEMALCVFGSNLGTQIEGHGAQAASQTHKETEEQIVDSDADLLSDTLRMTLFQWLVDYNFPGAGAPYLKRVRPTNELEHEDLRNKRVTNMKAELDLLFSTAGKLPPQEFAKLAAALAGIDLLPHVPDDLLRKLAPHIAAARANLLDAAQRDALPMPANANDPATQTVRQIAFADQHGHDHGLGLVADQMEAAFQPMMTSWLDRIRSQIDDGIANGEDLAKFSERLLAVDSKLSLDAMGNMMALAVEASELTGRVDVSDVIKAKAAKK